MDSVHLCSHCFVKFSLKSIELSIKRDVSVWELWKDSLANNFYHSWLVPQPKLALFNISDVWVCKMYEICIRPTFSGLYKWSAQTVSNASMISHYQISQIYNSCYTHNNEAHSSYNSRGHPVFKPKPLRIFVFKCIF